MVLLMAKLGMDSVLAFGTLGTLIEIAGAETFSQ